MKQPKLKNNNFTLRSFFVLDSHYEISSTSLSNELGLILIMFLSSEPLFFCLFFVVE